MKPTVIQSSQRKRIIGRMTAIGSTNQLTIPLCANGKESSSWTPQTSQGTIEQTTTKFKYKIGEAVWYIDEWRVVEQLRVYYGRPYYRLEGGKIVSETFL